MDILKKAKSKALICLIIWAVLAFIVLGIGILGSGYTLADLTGNYCVINNYADYQECAKKGNYFVKVNSKYVYEAGYEFYVDSKNNVTSKILDVEIPYSNNEEDGYMSLFSLIPTKEADSMLASTENSEMISYIGHLAKFDKSEYIKGLNIIIDDYIDYYTSDEFYEKTGLYYTIEDVNNFILPLQVNSYDDNISSMYMFTGIFGIVSLIFIILAIKSLLIVIDPTRNKSLRYMHIDDINEANREYQNGIFSISSNKVKVSEHFIYFSSFFTFDVCKISDIVWIYEREVRSRYGVNIFLRLNMRNGKFHEISGKKEEISKYIEELKNKNKTIAVGFTKENKDAFKINPENMPKQ